VAPSFTTLAALKLPPPLVDTLDVVSSPEKGVLSSPEKSPENASIEEKATMSLEPSPSTPSLSSSWQSPRYFYSSQSQFSAQPQSNLSLSGTFDNSLNRSKTFTSHLSLKSVRRGAEKGKEEKLRDRKSLGRSDKSEKNLNLRFHAVAIGRKQATEPQPLTPTSLAKNHSDVSSYAFKPDKHERNVKSKPINILHSVRKIARLSDQIDAAETLHTEPTEDGDMETKKKEKSKVKTTKH
jgi:hypothetical protein